MLHQNYALVLIVISILFLLCCIWSRYEGDSGMIKLIRSKGNHMSEDTNNTGDSKGDHNNTTNESYAQDNSINPKTIDKTNQEQEDERWLIYKELNVTLEGIRKSCGQICDHNVEGSPGMFCDVMKKDMDCKALFESEDIDKPSKFDPPPRTLPNYLIQEFIYNGRVELKHRYYNDAHGGHWLIWSEEEISGLRQKFRLGTLRGNYGISSVKNIHRHLTQHMNITGKHVLVVGSQSPWLEAIILEVGAAKITTLDYAQMKSEHPQIDIVTPLEIREGYLDGTFKEAFDVVVSFSSLEHSGLGRYGDALNPWGDLISMARNYCLLKPGGQALIGVPSGPKDVLFFNAHRVYGPIMLSHLFANWKQVYNEVDRKKARTGCVWCYQPLYVLEKE